MAVDDSKLIQLAGRTANKRVLCLLFLFQIQAVG